MKNEQGANHYQAWLLEEFAARKSRNGSYSLRAFAKSLGVSKTTLSDVLAEKRHLSKIAAIRVAEKLGLSPKQKEVLLHEIRRGSSKKFFAPLRDTVDHVEFLQLQEDQFKLISDWYYIGILTLAQFKNQKADPKWISRRLGISEVEAQTAVTALNRLALLDVKNGKLVRTGLPIKTTHQIPSAAIRSYHKQNLKLAERSLERDPIDRRIFGTISMPVRLSDLPKADQMIQDFKLQLSAALDTTAPDEVYTLSIQLFPVTKKEDVSNE